MLALPIENTITAIVCLISAVIIQRIYIKERLRGSSLQSIEGIKWFGWAIFVWGLGALVSLVAVGVLDWGPSTKELTYFGLVISLSNSLFILLSLPSIEHKKDHGLLVRLVQRFTTKEFIFLYSGVLGMMVFVFVAATFSNVGLSNNLIWLIDIPISIAVAFALLLELNRAFAARQMRFMLLPTTALFVLIIIAVCHRILPQDRLTSMVDQEFWGQVGSVTAVSFKFLFIFLFSILLYSWKFLSEKEEQQSLATALVVENTQLKDQKENLILSTESHLDTIRHLKSELEILHEQAKIELSERQKEVLANLALMGINASYPEVAAAMHISLDGFQTHIHQIKKILKVSGAGGKQELIAFAKANELEGYGSVGK